MCLNSGGMTTPKILILKLILQRENGREYYDTFFT